MKENKRRKIMNKLDLTLIWTIFNVICALIHSIGKKWNDELNEIWKGYFHRWWKYVWITILIDIFIDIIYLLKLMNTYNLNINDLIKLSVFY